MEQLSSPVVGEPSHKAIKGKKFQLPKPKAKKSVQILDTGSPSQTEEAVPLPRPSLKASAMVATESAKTEAAALKIQASQRRRAARKEVEEKRKEKASKASM